MKITKKIPLVLLTFLTLTARSQVPALFSNVTKRFFLKGPDSSCVALYYYVGDYKPSNIQIAYVQPFPITNNLSVTKSGKSHMVINIYKNIRDALLKHETKKMSIDLEFNTLPDTVNYYLQIPKVIIGKKIKATVDTHYYKLIDADSCCNRFIAACHPRLTKLIDITTVVFPKSKKSNDLTR
jgi:hypothetical protein